MSNNINRKIPLEELDKEELIKRCKNFLLLAQKAKASKDDAEKRENMMLDKMTQMEHSVMKLEKENLEYKQYIEGIQSKEKPTMDFLLNKVAGSDEVELKSDPKAGSAEINFQLKELEESYSIQKMGFIEELNKMNDLLKKRGETITQLEEKCQVLANDLKTRTEELSFIIQDKEKKIEQLEQDLNRWETQNEVASTYSAVSRTEEVHRLKDVEDSIEERYNKLKMLAVKMKKKISEQNITLAEKDKRINILEQMKNMSGSPSLNLPALQKDIDRLNDELDTKQKQMSVMRKDLENAIQELATTKVTSEELRNEVANLKTTVANIQTENQTLDLSNQELRTSLNYQLKENESNKFVKLEMSRECDKLREEVQDLQTKLDQINNCQEAAKLGSKKHSLLELELSDYEKSVSELNMRLNVLQIENKRLQNLLNEHNHEKITLLNRIKTFEDNIEYERKQSEEAKKTLSSLRDEYEHLKRDKEGLHADIKKFTERYEMKERELEETRLQLSSTNAEYQKYRTSSILKSDTLENQIANLEEKLALEQKTRKTVELHLTELQQEFESYKVRAASVLKKAKKEVAVVTPKEISSDEYTTQVEREMLQRVVEALKLKVSELESQNSLVHGEIESLRAEKERMIANHLIALDAMQQRLQHCETFSEKQKQEYQNQIMRIQNDHQLLNSLHREQVENLKMEHTQELSMLKVQLEQTALEAAQLQNTIQKLQRNHQTSKPPSPCSKDSLPEMNTNNWDRKKNDETGSLSDISFNRENSFSDIHKPIPLDLLLTSSSIQDETEVQTHENKPGFMNHLKDSLAVYEKQCQHLAGLLAESEANEARLSQLADALKEEIRRSQRAEEREKHIENLEYLKNIVLKFITLPRGEERSRLVPVLTTLLRLSPVEVQELLQSLSRNEGSTRPTAWGGVFNYFAQNQ